MYPDERARALASRPAVQQEIERLMDEGDYRQAAQLAARAKAEARTERERRRYHGLLLFANSRLPRWQQVSTEEVTRTA